VERIAPIFPVRDLDAALVHYRRLGFTTREYEGGGYGYATRGAVELHLGVVPDGATGSSAYLWVEEPTPSPRSGGRRGWRSTGPRTPTGASTRAPTSTPTATCSASVHPFPSGPLGRSVEPWSWSTP
jgi:hypothetical protein